jgi:hypothetical protein
MMEKIVIMMDGGQAVRKKRFSCCGLSLSAGIGNQEILI